MAECGFDGGYTIVQQCVKARKSELKRAKDEFLHLEWAPAEAQVDFGVCDFRILGIVREVHYLVVTFPFSNVSLVQCFRGESSECVCEGLKAVFEFCGGVPTRLVFDNATGVGRRVGEAISTADTFERFAAHYGFSFTFCNPRSGNEKGAVENAVGAVRRNVFVPMPRVDNLRAYTSACSTPAWAAPTRTTISKASRSASCSRRTAPRCSSCRRGRSGWSRSAARRCLCQAGNEQSGTRNLSSLADGLVKRSPSRASGPRPCGGSIPRTR